MDVRLTFQKKSLPKRGLAPNETPRWSVFWSRPIRLIRGRWHSPQVAPAAPPAPRVHSSIKLVLKTLLDARTMFVSTGCTLIGPNTDLTNFVNLGPKNPSKAVQVVQIHSISLQGSEKNPAGVIFFF